MVTKTQYEVFKAMYDEELKRYSELENRAKLYLTIITFYLGAIAFKVEDLVNFSARFKIPFWLYIVMAIVLLGALLLTVLATRIRVYEGITDPTEVIRSFGENPPTEEDFLYDRIVDLAVATNRNSVQNDKVATALQYSAYLLFIAITLQLITFLIAIIHL